MGTIGTKKPVNHDNRLLTLRDMTGPLFRKWRAVIAAFCAIIAITVVVAWGWANRYYSATMQVVVSRERSDPTVTGQQTGSLLSKPDVTVDEVVSEMALLQGQDMLQEVVETCKLTRRQPSVLNFWNDADSQAPASD